MVGPTAVGKTTLSIELAKWLNTEIISADSRQFYTELNIGTAKPTQLELQEIKHHFIDCQSIESNYSAGDFERDALDTLQTIYKTKDVAVLVGGSGMYIDALCDGLDEIPFVDSTIREKLNQQVSLEGLNQIQTLLQKLDPEYYNKVDLKNKHRVIRAVEVCLQTGQPYSIFRKKKKKNRPFITIKIGLHLERDKLFRNIDDRMDQMLEAGLIQEATELLPYNQHNALKTVGYSEVYQYLDGKFDKIEMIRLMKRNTHRYAKRQMTWFNRDHSITWFYPQEREAIKSLIQLKMESTMI